MYLVGIINVIIYIWSNLRCFDSPIKLERLIILDGVSEILYGSICSPCCMAPSLFRSAKLLNLYGGLQGDGVVWQIKLV